MVYNGYYKVMSNIPKMEQLSTPVQDRTRTQPTMGQTVWKKHDFKQCLQMGLFENGVPLNPVVYPSGNLT